MLHANPVQSFIVTEGDLQCNTSTRNLQPILPITQPLTIPLPPCTTLNLRMDEEVPLMTTSPLDSPNRTVKLYFHLSTIRRNINLKLSNQVQTLACAFVEPPNFRSITDVFPIALLILNTAAEKGSALVVPWPIHAHG